MVEQKKIESEKSFKDLKLKQWLINNLESVNITKPTGIQQQTLQYTLTGKNVIGAAHTGSGKTACFALPILQKLSMDPYGIFGVILTPTRELAYQINEQFKVFAGQNLNLRTSVIVGGVDMMKQAQELSDIPHLIIGTPGRLAHSLRHDQFKLHEYLDNLQFLVIDEADRLLTDQSFKDDLTQCLDAINEAQTMRRQTFLFSATMVKKLDAVVSKESIFGKYLPNQDQKNNNESDDQNLEDIYDTVQCGNDMEADSNFQRTVEGLTQKFCLVPQSLKESYLIHVLNNYQLKKTQQCIVFTSTCRNCHFLAMLMNELGMDVTMLHSQLEQRRRIANLGKFKSNFVKILVATDVASRGLDIPSAQFVVNFDVPRDPRDYVHRVGRVARAGRGGESITFVTQYDVTLIQAAEEYIGRKLDTEEIDEKEATDDITQLMKVMQVVRIKMSEQGITDKFDNFAEEKRRIRKQKSKDGQKQLSVQDDDSVKHKKQQPKQDSPQSANKSKTQSKKRKHSAK